MRWREYRKNQTHSHLAHHITPTFMNGFPMLNQTHRPLSSLLMNTGEWCRPDPRHLPGIEAIVRLLRSGQPCAPAEVGPEMLCFYRAQRRHRGSVDPEADIGPETLCFYRGCSFHALALKDGPLRGTAMLAVDPKEADDRWRECLRAHQQFLPPYDTLGFIAQARAPQPVPWLAVSFDLEGFESASESQIVRAMTTFWTAAFALLECTGAGQEPAARANPAERPTQ
jgi:hypothetical protein